MDKKTEKVLRKAAFLVMASHLLTITGRVGLSLLEVETILGVSRPTARKFCAGLIADNKMDFFSDVKGKIFVSVMFNNFTEKERERARTAYENLKWELSQ